MKRLISLFDYTGAWSEPFRYAYGGRTGWEVIQWDIKLDKFMDVMLLDSAETCLDLFDDVHGILVAMPCTEFAVSGSRWWKQKDAAGITKKSLAIAYQALKFCDLFTPTDPDYDDTFFYAIENPVGRLAKMCGLGEAYWFHPWEFAGYTQPTNDELFQLECIRRKNGFGVTPEEWELILKTNAYCKKTGLWGGFNRNLCKDYPIEPVKGAPQGSPLQRLGGKSDKTKELRSATPLGFARAFHSANEDYCYNPSRILA